MIVSAAGCCWFTGVRLSLQVRHGFNKVSTGFKNQFLVLTHVLLFCPGPLCPYPVITHGALVCTPAAGGRQSCDLTCYRGYQNALSVSSFLCQTESQQWDGDHRPLGAACQSKISKGPFRCFTSGFISDSTMSLIQFLYILFCTLFLPLTLDPFFLLLVSRPLLSVSTSQLWNLSSSCSQIRSLQSMLYRSVTSRGLCSAQVNLYKEKEPNL